MNVSSTISGRPILWASSLMALMSATSKAGLLTVSVKKARVFSSAAAAKAEGEFESTNFTVMPSVGRMSLNCVYVPPYKFRALTMLSPAWARLMME